MSDPDDEANQKYFPLLDSNGRLTNKFPDRIEHPSCGRESGNRGNERVVRPRLADANSSSIRTGRSRWMPACMLDKVVYPQPSSAHR